MSRTRIRRREPPDDGQPGQRSRRRRRRFGTMWRTVLHLLITSAHEWKRLTLSRSLAFPFNSRWDENIFPAFMTAPGLQTTTIPPHSASTRTNGRANAVSDLFLTVQLEQMSLETLSQTHCQFGGFRKDFPSFTHNLILLLLLLLHVPNTVNTRHGYKKPPKKKSPKSHAKPKKKKKSNVSKRRKRRELSDR